SMGPRTKITMPEPTGSEFENFDGMMSVLIQAKEKGISMNKHDRTFTDRLKKRRAASLFFAFAFAALSAQAQTSGATVDSLASDLAALTARVAKLEGQIVAADLVGTYALHGIQVELSG